MKRMTTALLLAAALALPLACPAEEAVRLDGRIEAAVVRTITAPHTGRVGDYSVREGEWVQGGETVFTLSAEPVYAQFDGTVTGLFAEAGDQAAVVQDRYGALCYMEREHLYEADCSTSGADSDNENRIIHVGEHVYIRSKDNEDRRGEALVTGVEGSRYTLEVLSSVDIRLNEQIKVYRDDHYRSADCIGSGKVHRVDPVGVTAEGYVRRVYAADGQRVRRGDLLFEVVPDALDGLRGSDGSVTMPVDGVVLSVMAQSGEEIAKDQPMATYCEKQDMQLVCPADEEDLAAIQVGMEVPVTLDAYRDETMTGTVVSIAGASAEGGSSASFDVTIRLPENEHVRIGMNATAEF